MREFNTKEKLIIKQIANIDVSSMATCSKFLQDNFFTKDTKKALIVNHTTKDILFYIEPNLYNDINEIRKSNYELFELLVLLKYLKENRYISLITTKQPVSSFEALYSEFDSSISQNGNQLILNTNGDYLLTNQPDLIKDSNNQIILKGGLLNEYYDLINDTVFGLIFPSQELIQLVKHNFKSKEDRKHRQNICAAWFGIVIALILGLLGIWNPLENDSEVKTKQSIQILNKLDTIKNNSLKSSSYLNEINTRLKKQYTQKKKP
ncbi:hypothetical protein [Flavobacterium commune]|uniref:Uncharacterized protein n=1 Tax=Flavobacterium commune TaxID=1306519 RepID=A0A1D9PBI3_9FLAO|nr:hypothetical protein [Flavobacterium commune]AOZ99929.1 hypothetical protein BIW12_11110 [Flavobacterium commune]